MGQPIIGHPSGGTACVRCISSPFKVAARIFLIETKARPSPIQVAARIFRLKPNPNPPKIRVHCLIQFLTESLFHSAPKQHAILLPPTASLNGLRWCGPFNRWYYVCLLFYFYIENKTIKEYFQLWKKIWIVVF